MGIRSVKNFLTRSLITYVEKFKTFDSFEFDRKRSRATWIIWLFHVKSLSLILVFQALKLTLEFVDI